MPVLHKETFAVPKPRGVSTPAKCAGDGSYEQAVECFRMSTGFRFRVTSPALNGVGTLQRPRIGQERVTMGEWTAETTPGGIVWTRGGKPATPSVELERLYQRLTLYLDPQKKEGTPQLAGSTAKANHYHFTDVNSGEAYDVFVAKDDGRIVELRAGKTDVVIQ
ncbi:MAG TPA: hypothetical protein VG323_14035 [Thermoanaerobaculia bacterium]|nr:hypothetical protein [Thermoanaerobaculia bacterium]